MKGAEVERRPLPARAASRLLSNPGIDDKMTNMSTLEEIVAVVPQLTAEELTELETLIQSERRRKQPVAWPDFAARLNRIFPHGPPPGKPLSEIVDEGRGDY